jgi:hypothetical protein
LKLRRRKYYGLPRHTVAAVFIVLILSYLLINPSAAISPGIARQIETRFATKPGLLADEDKAQDRPFCHVGVDAPSPYLRCGNPAEDFEMLRQAVIVLAGFDFLAKCGDMMRPRNSKSSKIGVSFRSKHKNGEAFDYNQEDVRVLIVREYKSGSIYWRTYLLCDKQDGSLGKKTNLQTDNVGFVSAYVLDFTAAAESLGWERIPAQPGWMYEPANKEYWHYQRVSEPQLSYHSALNSPFERYQD